MLKSSKTLLTKAAVFQITMPRKTSARILSVSLGQMYLSLRKIRYLRTNNCGCCAGSYGNAETHLIASLRYYLHNVNFVYFVDLDSPKKNVA